MTGLRHRTSRALLSALAGALTAAGLGGPLSGGALGAGVPPGSPSAATAGASEGPAGASEGPAIVSQRRQRTTAKNAARAKPKRARRKHAKPKTKRAKARTKRTRTGHAHAKPKQDTRFKHRDHAKPRHAKRVTGVANAPEGAVATGPSGPPPPWLVASQTEALAKLTDAGGLAPSAQALAFYRIPPFLLPIYRAAAIQYGVPWHILAAINEVETDYGNDQSVSTAGAVGWMQFMPATWMQYGVDALDAGYADPYNPVDAIFAAARYLRTAGAAKDLPAAIFAYNHSAEYVSSVLLRAKLISAYPESAIATLTCLSDGRLPLTGKVAWESFAPAAPPSPPAAAPNATALAPAAAAAAGVGTQAPRFVDLRSAPHASVVAVQSGRIVGLGDSRKLGFYVILRDAHGDVFTYAGLGSIASSYIVTKSSHGSIGARRLRVPLRRGSFVAQGAVLGRVRVPSGAKDGHLRFAIGPAGDPDTIDPRPILASWVLLGAALHPRGAPRPQGAQGGADPLEATTTSDVLALSRGQLERDLNRIPIGPRPTGATTRLTATVARSASSVRTAPSPSPVGGHLSTAQWNRLIARIGALRAPAVAVKPSPSAIGDGGQREDEW